MIIGILTDPGVGGTFVDWTINYLLGHSVTDHPIQPTNAHGHIPTKPNNPLKFDKWLQEVDTTQISTIYMHNFGNVSLTKSTDSYCPDTAKCVHKLQEIASKFIVCSLHNDQKLFHCTTKSRDPGPESADDAAHHTYVNTFFSLNKTKQRL